VLKNQEFPIPALAGFICQSFSFEFSILFISFRIKFHLLIYKLQFRLNKQSTRQVPASLEWNILLEQLALVLTGTFRLFLQNTAAGSSNAILHDGLILSAMI
jgi:hypothetical protein